MKCLRIYHLFQNHSNVLFLWLTSIVLALRENLQDPHASHKIAKAGTLYQRHLFSFCPGAAASVMGRSLQRDSSISRGLAPVQKQRIKTNKASAT